MSFYDDENDIEIDEGNSLSDDIRQEAKDRALEKFRNQLSERASGKTELAKNATKEVGKQAGKEAGKKVAGEVGAEASKQLTRQAVTRGATQAATSAATSGAAAGAAGAAGGAAAGSVVPIAGNIAGAAAGAIAGSAIQKAKEKEKDKSSGYKVTKKSVKYLIKRPWFWIIIIILMFILLITSIEQEATIQPIIDLVSRREKRYATSSRVTYERQVTDEEGNVTSTEIIKPFILFTEDEINELLYTSYYRMDSDERLIPDFSDGESAEKAISVLRTRTDNSFEYGLEDPCYNQILFGENTNEISSLLSFSGAESSEKGEELKISSEFVRECIKAEQDNFNDIDWYKGNNETKYKVTKKESFSTEEDFKNNSQKIKFNGGETVSKESIPDSSKKKYLNCDLLIPSLTEFPIDIEGESGRNIFFGTDDDEEAKGLMQYVSLVEDHLLKWIVPFVLLTDTNGDSEWVRKIMEDAQSDIEVTLYELQQLTKTTVKEYYLETASYYTFHVSRFTWEQIFQIDAFGKTIPVTVPKLVSEGDFNTKDNLYNGQYHNYDVNAGNSKDNPVGNYGGYSAESFGAPSLQNTSDGYIIITNVNKVYELEKDGSGNYIVAKDSNGKDMIREIRVDRELSRYKTLPKMTYVADMYNINEFVYSIDTIDESNTPDSTEGNDNSPVVLVSDNCATRTTVDIYQEKLEQTNLNSEYQNRSYSLSYLSEEEESKLGRKISRIEWAQDFGRVTDSEYSGSSVDADAVTDAIWQALINEGLPEITVAAIMGNIEAESSFNYTVENEIGAYGLCQWYSSRRFALQDFASDIGLAENDLEAQIAYLIHELNLPGTLNGYYGSVKSLAELKAIDDLEMATEQFCLAFERAGLPDDPSVHMDKRKSNAKKWYDKYTGTYTATTDTNNSSSKTKVLFGEGNIHAMYPSKSREEKKEAYDRYYGTRKTLFSGDITKGYSYDDLIVAFEYIEEAYKEIINKGYTSSGVVMPGPGEIFEGTGSGILQAPVQSGVITATMIYPSGRYHGALDYGVPIGTTVYAAADGVVITASYSGSYGNLVVIQHANGLRTYYAHGNGVYYVTPGQAVVKGQPIMQSGNTGNSTGPHLHLEVRVAPYSWNRSGNDSRRDPRLYL